jgi:hypothetical protein
MTAKKLFAECNLRTVFACKLRLKYLTTKSALTQNRVAASRAEPHARARRQIRVQQRTHKRRGGSRPLKRRTRTQASLPLALCALALIFQACAPARPGDARGKVATPANAPRPGVAAVDPFDEYMRAEFAPADGFDFPFGDVKVRAGEEVRRRQLIATVGQDPEKLFDAHLHLELRRDATLAPAYRPSSNGKGAAWVREHYEEPTSFIKSRRKLFVPQGESSLVLVDQTRYGMRLYEGGRVAGEYDISLGQGEGEKQAEGDDRTPKGMYFVVQKKRGEFPGPYGAYFGGHWIRVNYPNRFDAARGRGAKLITPEQESKIAAAWERREPTLETTRLGGGIGFHGWAREWEDSGPRHLSWGCVVLHLKDIPDFYSRLPEGAMVVIF